MNAKIIQFSERLKKRAAEVHNEFGEFEFEKFLPAVLRAATKDNETSLRFLWHFSMLAYRVGTADEYEGDLVSMTDALIENWVGDMEEDRPIKTAIGDELAGALTRMADAFRPFTLKPIGAPGSPARMDQDEKNEAHAEALLLLRKYRGET